MAASPSRRASSSRPHRLSPSAPRDRALVHVTLDPATGDWTLELPDTGHGLNAETLGWLLRTAVGAGNALNGSFGR